MRISEPTNYGLKRKMVLKSTPKHIAIVGGGFSGPMTAVNLARLSTRPGDGDQ
jgi:pyruvate/2-oxoglutarate dehydrogenase complex dihydrolipoamide dehydrogenase (E3) component